MMAREKLMARYDHLIALGDDYRDDALRSIISRGVETVLGECIADGQTHFSMDLTWWRDDDAEMAAWAASKDAEWLGLLWGVVLAAVFVAYQHMRMEE